MDFNAIESAMDMLREKSFPYSFGYLLYVPIYVCLWILFDKQKGVDPLGRYRNLTDFGLAYYD